MKCFACRILSNLRLYDVKMENNVDFPLCCIFHVSLFLLDFRKIRFQIVNFVGFDASADCSHV